MKKDSAKGLLFFLVDMLIRDFFQNNNNYSKNNGY